MSQYIIAGVFAVIVALIEAVAAKDRRRAKADREMRERESRLSMELMSATCELSLVTAIALKEGHTNGTLEPAVNRAKKAESDYQDFLKDVAAHDIAIK